MSYSNSKGVYKIERINQHMAVFSAGGYSNIVISQTAIKGLIN